MPIRPSESGRVSVAKRTPHDYGITAGMSVMLGMIENMASETYIESTEMNKGKE